MVQTDNHAIPIGFCLKYINGKPYVQITQVGFEPIPVNITMLGHQENPPQGFRIGNDVVVKMSIIKRKLYKYNVNNIVQ